MIEKKFIWKIYYFIVLFAIILFMAAKVVYMLFNGEVTYENNEKLTKDEIDTISRLCNNKQHTA